MNKTTHKKSIGVFDSGFGGLTILKQIVKVLPKHDYVYLGDTARVPYGSRSKEVVYKFTKQAVDFLFSQGCELIIIACNTASAEALRKIQQEYLPEHYPDKRVLGVIVPAVQDAAIRTKNNRIGLIATESTVASGTFARELKTVNPRIKLFSQAAPLLVPLIESGQGDSQAAKLILAEYLKPLKTKKIDTLILGCTHYSVMEAQIKKEMGERVMLVSEGGIVARKLKEYLSRHPEIDSLLSKNSKRFFYTTDLTERFKTLGGRFFGKPISPLKAKLD